MTRLAYIFYIYIKANTHHTPSKIGKAIEEVRAVRNNLPLHLSSVFPANEDDKAWEAEHPWVPFQRYLLNHVLDFLQLGIARVLISAEADRETGDFRNIAVTAAKNILKNYVLQVPRVYRLVWTVSAAAVAAAVYIALDILAHHHEYSVNERFTIIDQLRRTAVELRRHAVVALHASKGSIIIEDLLPLLEQQPNSSPMTPPASVQDLLRQLSVTKPMPTMEQTPGVGSFIETAESVWQGAYNENDIFAALQDPPEAMVGVDEWDKFLLNL